jgi:hypothetical protein
VSKISPRHSGKIVDAVFFRMKNRRIKVALLRDGGFSFRFVRLIDGMPDVQRLRLSFAATQAICEGVCMLTERQRARVNAERTRGVEVGA